MRVRSSIAAVVMTALLVAACQQGGGGAGLRIGVVTDVGSVNDKNFNEYTYKGANDGATAVGAPNAGNLPVSVPATDADYVPVIQSYVDQDFNVIVTTGFNLTNPTTTQAKANPETWFIGVDHAPCINAAGDLDTTFTDCSGDLAQLYPKYVALNYAEDQAGYLAGMVAASASESDIIGAIGGISLCAPCIRYIQGYVLGAKAVNPDITVKVAWVTDSDFVKGFFDQAGGKTFANQFIQQNPGIDVLFQVAGQTGNGVIDAACEGGISAVGVDVDQYQSYPASQPCILTSAEKHLAVSVAESIKQIAAGTAKGGLTFFNASNDGIGVSPFYEAASKLPSDMQAQLDTALEGIKDGSIDTCPDNCGAVPAPPIGD